MSLSNRLLAKFERFGYREFEIGDTVARGFADVGYEEFALIAEHKILSTYTGKASALETHERDFFFKVFSIDEMIQYLQRQGVELRLLELEDGREWHVVAKRVDTLYELRGEGLQELLVDLMTALIQT